MNRKRFLTRLSKLLKTVLNHAPHEYGLVPDAEGFVRIKEVLQALHELDDCRRLRRSDIEELLVTMPSSGIEIAGNRIRASAYRPFHDSALATPPPKVLYTCIRRKAHASAFRTGIRRSATAPPIVLTPDAETAKRLGLRKDNDPILVTVNVRQATNAGAAISPAGEGLFVADSLPPAGLMLPPLPKENVRPESPPKPKTENAYRPAGSYLPAPEAWSSQEQKTPRHPQKRKDPEWKHQRKRKKR